MASIVIQLSSPRIQDIKFCGEESATQVFRIGNHGMLHGGCEARLMSPIVNQCHGSTDEWSK